MAEPGPFPLTFSPADLLPYVPFCIDQAIADAWLIQPHLDVFATSALHGTGIEVWCEYLEQA